jgi:DNA topoisomerase-1
VVRVVDEIARQLGNTRAVCRKHYIDPRILEAFLAGERDQTDVPRGPSGLGVRERDLLALLERFARAERRSLSAAA